MGDSASGANPYTIAIGRNSFANADFAVALGDNTWANIEGSVALGKSSRTNVKAGVLGYIPSGKELTRDEKDSPTWTSNLAAVSIGNSEKGYTRQITNVAAGTLDTDALTSLSLKL